jgi:hypothetical protein
MTGSFWDEPDAACPPCRGRGWIVVEDPSGAPGREVECPYCHGRQTAGWVAERHVGRLNRLSHRRWILGAAMVVWLCCGHLPWLVTDSNSYGQQDVWALPVYVLVWIVLIVAWVISPSKRSVVRADRRNNGFTDDREKVALGIFAGVVGLKGAWDHRKQQRGF